jgi:RNA polymerase sigma-70 factor (ECF subfamily)
MEYRRVGFEREALMHLDALYRGARMLAGNAADADDLVQTAVFNAYRYWHNFRPGTNVRAWLLAILRNVFLREHSRRLVWEATVDLDAIEPVLASDSDGNTDPEARFFDELVDGEVLRAIAALPLEQREVLELVSIEGLRLGEAAETLSIPVGTVKSRLFRARKVLQVELYEYATSIGWIQEAQPAA